MLFINIFRKSNAKYKASMDLIRETKKVEVLAVKKLEGEYDVIVIDPPWPMQKIERDGRPNQSAFDYPTMGEAMKKAKA
jgi:predicted RNA methylase